MNPLQTLTVLHLFLEAVLGRAAGVPVPPYVEVRQQITQPIMNPTRDESRDKEMFDAWKKENGFK